MEIQIKGLHETVITVEQRHIKVTHKLIFTMVDGKVCNALTETKSAQKCFICGATSKQFKHIDEMIATNIKTENLQFGLSVQRGWIHMLKRILHLAYKLPIKKWQARGSEEK